MKRKPPKNAGKRVRSATKTEMNDRALKAMNERTRMLQRLQENEIILAAVVAQQGRVRLSASDLRKVGEGGESLEIRSDDIGGLVLEIVPGAVEQEQRQEPQVSKGVAALMRGGMTVVEHDPKGS